RSLRYMSAGKRGVCVVGFRCGWAQPVAFPSTPAGTVLQAWYEAFNSGDRARMQAYLTRYDPERSLDGMVSFRDQTGGLELLGIDRSEARRIDFRVKEKGGTLTAVGKLELKEGESPLVPNFGVRAIPPGTNAADMNLKIDAAVGGRVIDGAIAKLNENYVFPETAKKMEDALRTHQSKGDYDKVTEGDAFASVLTNHLQEVSHDKHL